MNRREARLNRILKRQAYPGWGKDYVPGQLATREEAPSVSRPTILVARKLGGREIHLLGEPEAYIAALALYWPISVDLQEQRMLSLVPRPNPMHGHLLAAGLVLPPLQGTLDVADRLGFETIHELVRIRPNGDADVTLVPMPFLGDLLVFLADDQGLYCVNLNVKARAGDHDKAFGGVQHRDGRAADFKAQCRYHLEVVYYKDAKIPTRPVALDQLDRHVRHNLLQLFAWHSVAIDLADDARSDLEAAFACGISTNTAPLETILHSVRRHNIDEHTCKAILYQAIWNRRLRVDLFSPILINKRLQPEHSDVVDVYAHWFARGP